MLSAFLAFTLPAFLAALGVTQAAVHHHTSGHHPSRRSVFPEVTTSDNSTWIGRSALNVDSFKGIPFAQPPVGDLRFAPPVPPNSSFGIRDASLYGKTCPEMFEPEVVPESWLAKVTAFNSMFKKDPLLRKIDAAASAEDCLTLNIFRPAGLNATAGLPILFWIYPGGFFFGSSVVYDGTAMVARSVKIGQPMIMVTVNHRTNSFGFLPGKEVAADPTASVNAGLLDQRLALEWTSQHISSFGGDPSKVTINGLSSGSISVAFQMEAYGGNITSVNTGLPLFRGAIMQSGSPIPVDVTSRGQHSFDVIARATGCYNATNAIACLRAVPYQDLFRATNLLPTIASYHSASLSFLPRTDGDFLREDTTSLVAAGSYAKVPILSGDNADEGTILCALTTNITTEAQLDNWLATIWFPNITPAVRAEMLKLYPADPRLGSPFNTGLGNVLTPQNKRINAMIGDLVFQAPRRAFVNATRHTQPTWSYASTANHLTPLLGSFHANDVLASPLGISQTAAAVEMRDRWITFTNTLQPNLPPYIYWPTYGSNATLLQFTDGATSLTLDNYRHQAIQFLIDHMAEFAL